MRTLVLRADRLHWLARWRQARRQKLVGRGSVPTVEEVWLASQLEQRKSRLLLDSFSENSMFWGAAALFTFLPLAYVSLWCGLMAAGATFR